MEDRELRKLAGRAASGDLDAADALFSGLHGPLFAHLYLLGVPSEDVEDVAQEAALQVYRSLKTYRPAQPFLPWMRSIAAHVAGNYWRSRKKERQGGTAFRRYLEQKWAECDGGAAIGKWISNGLRSCIDRLQPRQRELVSLRYFDDLDSSSIASQLSMKASAVRMSLARTRDVLRMCLEASGW